MLLKMRTNRLSKTRGYIHCSAAGTVPSGRTKKCDCALLYDLNLRAQRYGHKRLSFGTLLFTGNEET